MKARLFLRPLIAALVMLLGVGAASGSLWPAAARAAAPANAADLLRAMATAAPDGCSERDHGAQPEAETAALQARFADTLETELAERLNAPTPRPATAADAPARLGAALREIEAASAAADKAWPDEDRFSFQVLDVSPALAVTFSYRGQAWVALYASYDLHGDATDTPGVRWRRVDLLDAPDAEAAVSTVTLYALHRGPAGHARLLVSAMRSGCAGSVGEAYYGYAWGPGDSQSADEFLKIEGAEGLDDTASVHVGRLKTEGPVLELPYCFFSAVDTWDNPTLCAADTFDLSGDTPHFTGRRYNRPDLVTVAMAISHAEAHDALALRGYCASDAAARALLRDSTPLTIAEDLQVRRTGPGRERVTLSDADRFDLVRRHGRWLVARYTRAAGP